MFKQLMARFSEDDNPRLHRIPFLLMWMASYALAWFPLRLYEILWRNFWHDWRFCGLYRWLKYDTYFPANDWWREDLLLGMMFALVLSLFQTWLLRKRYGYVPKFWRMASIIGALLAGFGYPRVGIADYPGAYRDLSESFIVLDFLIWFIVLNLFQAIVMLRVNRNAWQLAAVGIIAGLSASAIYYFGLAGTLLSAKLALLTGLLIQITGSSLLMLRLMAEPREGIIPKRDSTEKPKNRPDDGIGSITFIALWTGTLLLGRFMVIFLWELYDMISRIPAVYKFNRWWFNELDFAWVHFFVFYALAAFVWTTAQKWLMRKYRHVHVRHWIIVNVFGWGIAGICIAFNRYSTPHSQLKIWQIGYFIIPCLFQTMAMMRTFRRGWLWLLTGCTAALVAIYFLGSMNYWMYHGIRAGTLLYAISTALLFLFLKENSTRPSEKMKRSLEVS